MKSNPTMLRRLSVLLILGLTGFNSYAQEPDNQPKVSLKINLVAWGEDIPGLRIKSKSKAKETTALGFRYSKPLNYSGSRILEISQKEGAELPPPPDREFDPRFDKPRPKTPVKDKAQEAVDRSETPKEILRRREKNPELIALATLPTNSSQVTILLAPGSGGTYQTYVIDDDPRRLKKGVLKIHNLSHEKVAIQCNKLPPKQLSYGESMMVAPSKKKSIIYKLAYLKGDKWKTQETNLINVGPQDQVQFIILQSNASYFSSGTGSRTGHLQRVELRRTPADEAAAAESNE